MHRKIINLLFLSFLVFILLGITSCGGPAKVKLEPESRNFYETARLIMTGEEKDIFSHLPDEESRKEFIKDFWVKRDPDPDTEENEFKEEFFRRIEYANERFHEGPPGWKTDRGRIYIYFGPPDKIERRPMLNIPDMKGYLLWVYYRYGGLGVAFVDKRGDGTYAMDLSLYTSAGGIYGSFFDALERAKFGLITAEDEFKKKLMDFGLEFNREKKEIVISIPVENLSFIEEDGLLKADFEFEFSVYKKKGGKIQSFQETRNFEEPEEKVIQMENIVFTFSLDDLEPGKYYLDVVIIGKEGIGKTRKIFEIKV